MAWRYGRLWPIFLGLLVILYGLMHLDILSVDSTIVGIWELVTGVLILINR